jgi:transcriptional regulator GlxA family with amidase domain
MFAGDRVLHALAKRLVVDSGTREQRYYSCFTPRLDHGDRAILQVQRFIAGNFHEVVLTRTMAELACLGERMFLRRFVKATGLKPTAYLQRFRVQKACELIETSDDAVEGVAMKVGYKDISAFRKIFSRVTGLTPQEFKKRFVKTQAA